MLPLDEALVRASFVNASRSERKSLTLPADFGERDWDRLDFLGWRDPRLPLVAYAVVPLDSGPVGLLLRQTEGRARTRPQCAWCADVQLPNDVVFLSARRAGDAGRRGDTIGTLVCEEFQCSHNVRKLPPLAYTGFDREAARERRIAMLRTNVENFARDVRDSA